MRQDAEDRGVEELLEEANKSEELTNTNTLNQAVDGIESEILVEDELAIDTENLLDLVDQSAKKNPDHESEGENASIDEHDENIDQDDLEDAEPDFSEDFDPNQGQEGSQGEEEDDTLTEKMNLNSTNKFSLISAFSDDARLHTLNRQMGINKLRSRQRKLQELIQTVRPEKEKFFNRFKNAVLANDRPKFEPKDQATELVIGKLSEFESLELFSSQEENQTKYELTIPFLKLAILFFEPENREIFKQTDNSVVFEKARSILDSNWNTHKQNLMDKILSDKFPVWTKILMERLIDQDKNILDAKFLTSKHTNLGFICGLLIAFLSHHGVKNENLLGFKSKQGQNFLNMYYYMAEKLSFYEGELEKTSALIAELEC